MPLVREGATSEAACVKLAVDYGIPLPAICEAVVEGGSFSWPVLFVVHRLPSLIALLPERPRCNTASGKQIEVF